MFLFVKGWSDMTMHGTLLDVLEVVVDQNS